MAEFMGVLHGCHADARMRAAGARMPRSPSKYAPLYLKLKNELTRKIRSGEYAPRQQLPATDYYELPAGPR
jgi:hypothetical protein